ncbi:hypothetical protein OG216_47370 (plasmid) [Streptomycetaceae bacterium NBC_01309]
MHEMRLDTGGDRPRSWHVTEPGERVALCGADTDPLGAAGIDDADMHAAHCADCLTVYGALVAAATA